jgi:hypothetical protein
MVAVACFLPGRAKDLSAPLVHNKRHRSRELNPPNAATKAGHGNPHLPREQTESWKSKRFFPRTLQFLTFQILLFSSRFPVVLCAFHQRHPAYATLTKRLQ